MRRSIVPVVSPWTIASTRAAAPIGREPSDPKDLEAVGSRPRSGQDRHGSGCEVGDDELVVGPDR